jgi:hypothetical protein
LNSQKNSNRLFAIVVTVVLICAWLAWIILSEESESNRLRGKKTDSNRNHIGSDRRDTQSLPDAKTTQEVSNSSIDSPMTVELRDSITGKRLPQVVIAHAHSLETEVSVSNNNGNAKLAIPFSQLSELRFMLPMELGGDGEYLNATSITKSGASSALVELPVFARVRVFIEGAAEPGQTIGVAFVDNRHVNGVSSAVSSMRRRNPKVWLKMVKGDPSRESPFLDLRQKVRTDQLTTIDIPHSGDIAVVGEVGNSNCQPCFLTIRAGLESNATLKVEERPVIKGRLIDDDTDQPLANWELVVSTSAIFDGSTSIPNDRNMASSQGIREDGSVRSILLASTTTDSKGEFEISMPFTGSVAFWNEKAHSHTTGFCDFSLATLSSDGGPFEVRVSEIRTRSYMQLRLNGKKVLGLKGAKALPTKSSPYAFRFDLDVDPDGRVDVSRLREGDSYLLAGFIGRGDLKSFVEFRCQPNGTIDLETQK